MKKDKKNVNLPESGEEEKVRAAKTTLTRFLLIIVNTVFFYTVYYFLANGKAGYVLSQVVMWTYLAALIGFFSAYIIYNKGFTMVDRSADSFPEDWSYEKMCAVTEEGKRRKEKSKWMLYIIVPLMFTFMFDMIDLFILDRFKYLF